MSRGPCRVAVLGSGEGTNFEALAAAAGPDYEIVVAGSDRSGAPMLARARRRGIPGFCVSAAEYRDRAAHEAALTRALAPFRPDLVALAGYLRILGSTFLADWEGRLLNIHPALLPAFAGLDTHRRAIACGAIHHGATVHYVTEELDAGPRIVQGRLTITPGESPERLASRVHALEHRIYPLAVGWCARGRLALREGKVCLDGRLLASPVLIEEGDAR